MLGTTELEYLLMFLIHYVKHSELSFCLKCAVYKILQCLLKSELNPWTYCSWISEILVIDDTQVGMYASSQIYVFWINAHHTEFFLFVIYLFVLSFLSVLDYCNLVNSHLKSSHWPDALKSMIFIFTITIIGPIETGKTQSKRKRNIFMFSALYFVQCLFL